MTEARDIFKKHMKAYLDAGKTSVEDRAEAIDLAMIEFTAIHVTQALFVASEQFDEGFSKKVILNSYSLTNIK